MYYAIKNTPAGKLLFTSNGSTITGIHWVAFKRAPQIQLDWIENKEIFSEVISQFEEYFIGKRTNFTFTYNLQGTEFQKAVWKELESIPYGKSSSYKAIATAIGRPKAVRAVGTAVGSNPLSIIVPCHRVLTSTAALGGYAGGIESKKCLLQIENISFTERQVYNSDLTGVGF